MRRNGKTNTRGDHASHPTGTRRYCAHSCRATHIEVIVTRRQPPLRSSLSFTAQQGSAYRRGCRVELGADCVSPVSCQPFAPLHEHRWLLLHTSRGTGSRRHDVRGMGWCTTRGRSGVYASSPPCHSSGLTIFTGHSVTLISRFSLNTHMHTLSLSLSLCFSLPLPLYARTSCTSAASTTTTAEMATVAADDAKLPKAVRCVE